MFCIVTGTGRVAFIVGGRFLPTIDYSSIAVAFSAVLRASYRITELDACCYAALDRQSRAVGLLFPEDAPADIIDVTALI